MRANFKKNRGITLIALVVTIIVIIILAGVSIMALTKSGIIGKAKDAADKTEQSTAEEEVQLSWLELYMENSDFDSLTLQRQAELLESELKSKYPDANSKIVEFDEEKKLIKVNHRGYDVAIESSKTGNNNTGGNTSGGNTSGGNTSGENTSGGNTSGGNTSSGNTSGGNTSTGGNTGTPDTPSYIILFESNGGSSVNSQTVKKGEKVTRPTEPTKSGYSFGGWYTDSECTSMYNFDNIVTGGMTLYAKWTSETSKEYFEWITTSKYATLIGFSDAGKTAYNNGDITELSIPSIYNGVPVNKINTSAFKGYTKISKLVIPDSVEIITSNAFYGCSGIEEISIPVSTNYMTDSSVFYGCTGIKKVTLTPGNGEVKDYTTSTYQYTPWYYSKGNNIDVVVNSGTKKVGDYTFYSNSGIKTVNIGDGVENIGTGAFLSCKGITQLYVGANVIGSSAFNGCTALVVAEIGENVKEIGFSAFKNCSSMDLTYSDTSLTLVGESAFEGCKGIVGKLTLLKNTEKIGSKAFYGCTGITGFTMSKIINIGNNAFEGCTYLSTGIEGLSTCEIIGNYAFKDCNNLNSGTVVFNNIREVGDYAFDGKSGINIKIESDNLQKLGNYAFRKCSKLNGVVKISNGNIGDYAFNNCIGISGLILGENINSIGSYAFCDCTGITGTIEINGDFISKTGIFKNCVNIKKIIIGENVKDIGINCFTNDTGIEELAIPVSLNPCAPSTASISSSDPAFYNCTGIKK